MLAAMATLVCRAAKAQEPADPWTSRRFAVEGQFGYANPFGTVAVALDVGLLPWLSISAGGGLDPIGPQLGIMPRVRLARIGAEGRSALFVASGFSTGRVCRTNDIDAVSDCNPSDDGDYAYDLSLGFWSNSAIGFETRWTGGITLRLSAGVDVLLNPGAAKCAEYGDDMCRQGMPRTVVPALALALGYAF
jgi:hypothetical protein